MILNIELSCHGLNYNMIKFFQYIEFGSQFWGVPWLYKTEKQIFRGVIMDEDNLTPPLFVILDIQQ